MFFRFLGFCSFIDYPNSLCARSLFYSPFYLFFFLSPIAGMRFGGNVHTQKRKARRDGEGRKDNYFLSCFLVLIEPLSLLLIFNVYEPFFLASKKEREGKGFSVMNEEMDRSFERCLSFFSILFFSGCFLGLMFCLLVSVVGRMRDWKIVLELGSWLLVSVVG